MDAKYKISLVLFLIGMIITILGALFKVMHWPGASVLLIIGMLSEIIALINLIIVILMHYKETQQEY